MARKLYGTSIFSRIKSMLSRMEQGQGEGEAGASFLELWMEFGNNVYNNFCKRAMYGYWYRTLHSAAESIQSALD